MSFSEFEELNIKNNYKELFKEMYFLKYSKSDLDFEKKEEIYEKLKEIFLKN